MRLRASGRGCRLGLAFAFLAVLSPPAEAGTELVLPGVVRASGVGGSRFVSTLWIHNPATAAVDVDLVLVTPEGTRGPVRLTVGPRQTRRVDDPVSSLFSLEAAAGTLTARAEASFLLRGVTANVADPRGTYGLALESLRADAALEPGETGIAPGLSHTAATGTLFRTNVAVTLLEKGSEATVTVVDDSGLVRGEERVTGGPLFWQRPVSDLSPDPEVPLGRVEVRVLSGSAVAYAAVVDNGTGDGIVSPARRVEAPSGPPYALLLPGAARSAGANGTLWRTSLRLANPGLASVDVTLEGPAGSRVARVVPPRGLLEETDLLGALGQPEGSAGAVTVTSATRLSALPRRGTSTLRATVSVVPAVTTTYRWLPSSGCPGEVSASVTVEVTAPAGAVMTESGAVAGVTDGASAAWKGIPLAAPPVGALRWRPPAPPAPWTGVRDASAFGPICPQLDDAGTVSGAEDCLFLNVFAPAAPPTTPLPVLFFIHGGGNHFGEGSLPVYDGSVFAAEGRAVVVTVNYRLSSFGWLSQPFLSAETRRGVSGSYGTFDQLAALRWVRRNIAAFGGDPSRVTVFGESAGGANVCTLVASPLARSLFSAGIVESGGCVRRPISDFIAFGSTVDRKGGLCVRGRPGGVPACAPVRDGPPRRPALQLPHVVDGAALGPRGRRLRPPRLARRRDGEGRAQQGHLRHRRERGRDGRGRAVPHDRGGVPRARHRAVRRPRPARPREIPGVGLPDAAQGVRRRDDRRPVRLPVAPARPCCRAGRVEGLPLLLLLPGQPRLRRDPRRGAAVRLREPPLGPGVHARREGPAPSPPR